MLDWADATTLLALLVGVWQVYLARRASDLTRSPIVIVLRGERLSKKPSFRE
jgi:hypothetical protein